MTPLFTQPGEFFATSFLVGRDSQRGLAAPRPVRQGKCQVPQDTYGSAEYGNLSEFLQSLVHPQRLSQPGHLMIDGHSKPPVDRCHAMAWEIVAKGYAVPI